ncbi:flagellar biosynthetic protein FliQ, partial [Idiomarina sp.]
MSPEMFLDIFQEALKTIVIMVAFIIVPGLLVGLVVAVFQAATSI